MTATLKQKAPREKMKHGIDLERKLVGAEEKEIKAAEQKKRD